MLTKLEYYLKLQGQKQETIKAHLNRANTILNISTSWQYQDAAHWNYDHAQEHNYSESTLNKWSQTFNLLNRCFNWGWTENIHKIKENCAQREVLSLDETLRFYNLHTTDMYDLIVKLSITTGARPSEILTLKRSDIDLTRGIIALSHTKTKQNRLLFIQSFLKDELVQYLQKNNFALNQPVFPYYKDKTMSLNIRSLEKEYKKRLDILGIKKNVTPYCARHAYLTRMASCVNSVILKELAGHNNIKTTEKYVHNNEFILRQAAQKDFLFDDMRDWSIKIDKLITEINTLAQNHSSQLDCVKLSEAVLCLRQAIKT